MYPYYGTQIEGISGPELVRAKATLCSTLTNKSLGAAMLLQDRRE